MGKIAGWGSIDKETDIENPSTPIDHVNQQDDAPHADYQPATCKTVDREFPVYEVEENAVEEPCAPELEDDCGKTSQFQQTYTSEAPIESITARNISTQELVIRNPEVNEMGRDQMHADETARICAAIAHLKLSYSNGGVYTYCDITEASEKAIRALIRAADPNHLDLFRIMEAVQKVVSKQGEIAAAHGERISSPNLNELIEFIGSMATA